MGVRECINDFILLFYNFHALVYDANDLDPGMLKASSSSIVTLCAAKKSRVLNKYHAVG